MARFYAAEGHPPLIGAIRLDVFATIERTRGRGKRAKVERIGVAWQGWNPDARMADQMARLPGSGSFYWQGAIQAYTAAVRMLRDDPRVDQVKIETTSGQEIGRVYR